jgi:hypothetical protein
MPRGSIVLLRGTVQGMGREAKCDVLVRKEVSSSGSVEYTDCSIITAPADLPDGKYGVMLDDHFFVEKNTRDLVYRRGCSAGLMKGQATA